MKHTSGGGQRQRRLARRRPSPLPKRMLEGAMHGVPTGVCVALLELRAWGFTLPAPPGDLLKVILSSLVGGAAAGAWMAFMLPHMRRRVVAMAAGVGSVAIYIGMTALSGANWLNALPVILFGPVVGAFGGWLVRELSPLAVPADERARDEEESPAARLSAWLVRLAEGLEKESRVGEPRPAETFPDRWTAILRRNVVLYGRLPEPERDRLHAMVADFLRNKRFEGAGGQEITDEVRVTVAGQACMLALGFGTGRDPYLDLRSIVVYPTGYSAASHARQRFGDVDTDDADARLGESWKRGAVVLSWEDALKGAADPADGRNLVFHEFAHQLDQQTGAADGVPSMATLGGARTWARLLHGELERLRARLEEGEPDVLRPYGATSEAEFFAVATETFFEQPAALRAEHPELYTALRALYAFDPETLHPAAGPA